MLKAVIEEMNRYDEAPQTAMRMLNAKPEFSNDVKFNVLFTHKGNTITSGHIPKTWEGNPMTAERIRFDFNPNPPKTSKDDDDILAGIDDEQWISVYFSSGDLVQVLPKDGVYTFVQGDSKLVLTKVVQKFFHWDAV
jgi:hypothetical protein